MRPLISSFVAMGTRGQGGTVVRGMYGKAETLLKYLHNVPSRSRLER